MSVWNYVVTFYNGCTRGEIIGIIAIIVAIILFIVGMRYDIRKTCRNRIDAFVEPLLRLKTIIETNSIPSRDSYDEFIGQFPTHENSMSIVRSRMDGETKATFDKKWAEYKEEREGYKRYWDTNLTGKFSIHKRSNRLIILINELIKIAKKT